MNHFVPRRGWSPGRCNARYPASNAGVWIRRQIDRIMIRPSKERKRIRPSKEKIDLDSTGKKPDPDQFTKKKIGIAHGSIISWFLY